MTVAGQPTVNYQYDSASRLTQITQGSAVVGFGYDHVGRRTTLTLPNTVTVTYSYDNASQLQEIVYKRAQTTLGNVVYEYDGTGNRSKLGGSWARTGLPDQLTSAAYNAANQQTAFAGQTLSYDLNGNLSNDGNRTYTWNARNQLVSMASGSTTIASFQYDAFGRRISKTIGGATTGFAYDEANTVQELSGTTPIANLLTGGVDENFLRSDASGTATFLTDGLGSALALLDAAGATLSQYTYSPFGATTVSGSAANSFQFTGRENDGTGLYYYRARYYHPGFQRFIGEDSVASDINLYSYTSNDPVNATDPSGNFALALPAPLILGGGAAGPVGWIIVGGVVVLTTAWYLSKMNEDAATGEGSGTTREKCKDKDPCKGLRKTLQDHIDRLTKYQNDPFANDNLGLLKGLPPHLHQQIIAGRIRNLQNQIDNFRRLLEECERRHR